MSSALPAGSASAAAASASFRIARSSPSGLAVGPPKLIVAVVSTGAGWLFEVAVADGEATGDLLDAAAYEQLVTT